MAVKSIVKLSELGGAKRIDAEYYKPEYINFVDSLRNVGNIITFKRLGCEVVSGPFGSSLKSGAYRTSGIPFIRIQNLQGLFITKEDLVCISKEDNQRLKSSQLKVGDLVLSKVGNTIGVVSIVTSDIGRCNISENNIGIKFRHRDEDLKKYLTVYLNTKYGKQQILRLISGGAQPKLNVYDIYNMVLFIPQDSKFIEDISNKVDEIHDTFNLSIKLYTQAENLLLEGLGLKDFKPKYKLSYSTNLSDAFGTHRVDAEYFQPIYQDLIKNLNKNIELRPLGKLLVDFQKGIEVGSENYQEEGKPFIRVSNLSIHGLVEKDQKYISEELCAQLKDMYQPKIGDFLLTKDATPGIAYVVKEPTEGIIASGILKLSINENVINKEYLVLCINSAVGKLQIQRDGGGSVITHWRPDQIKKLQIPVLSDKIQKKIARLIQQSHEARRKAKQLLEEAKVKVEEAIEKAS